MAWLLVPRRYKRGASSFDSTGPPLRAGDFEVLEGGLVSHAGLSACQFRQ